VKPHDWREWLPDTEVFVCSQCGTTACPTLDRSVWFAALANGLLVVGQVVNEDCERFLLWAVHES